MHRWIMGTYRFSLRAQASYMMLLVGLSCFTAPIFQLGGVLMRTIMVTAIAAVIAFVLLKPRYQPAFLRAPSGFLTGLAAMFASNVVFLSAVFVGFIAVMNMGLQEPLSRHISILAAMPSFAFTGLMWLCALLLISIKPDNGTPPARQFIPPTPSAPVVSASDLRQLRQSR